MSGVLLHEVEASLPIDLAHDLVGRDWSLQDMGNALVLVDPVDYRNAGEAAEVVWLAT